MQQQPCKKLNWKKLLPVALTGISLLAPLALTPDNAEAKSRGKGNAWGHRKQSNWRNRHRRSSDRDWNNGVRRRTRTRSGWDSNDRWDRDDRDRDNRRYRLRYRTRYDRFGNPYRQWYLAYY